MFTERILANKFKGLKKSVLLLGPRQTGKSTLIQGLSPDLEINLADQEVFLRYSRDPGLIKSEIKDYQVIFIDEVQRIPSILNTLQTILDKDKSKLLLLTGSSAHKLRKGQANLLPGRILSYELGPLTHQELGKKFEVMRALEVGLLPGIYHEPDRGLAQKTLRSYAATYLKEEIQAEALTRNIEGFSRFFQVVSSRSGDFVDYSKISSAAMIERTTTRRYFDILIDTLVVSSIEAFAKSRRRRLVQHPKFFFFDTGVLNGCLDNFAVSADRVGNLFEHLVLQLVVSSAKAHDETIRISTYRTEAGVEVDFVIERKSKVYAVEVKASKNIGNHDLRGLKGFVDFYGKRCEPLVIYLGEKKSEVDGIQIVPLLDGLKLIGY